MKSTKSGRTFRKLGACRIVSLALLALCITLFIACGKNLLVIDFLDGKKSKPLPEVTVTAPKFAAVAEVYTQPAAQKIIINNNGRSKVTVKSVTVSPDTAFTVGGGGSTVSARSSIDTWTVRPNALLPQGDHMAIITVACSGTGGSAAANAVVTFTVTKSGGAILSVTVQPFNDEAEGYGSQPAAKNITITNTGSAPANITDVAVSDTAKFEIGGSGPMVDAHSNIATWTVRPQSGLAAGTHMAIITVTYNGAAANAVVTFTVTKPGAAILSVTAPTFGNEVEGYSGLPTAEPITITNNGVSAATINSVVVSPATAFTVYGTDTDVPSGGGILNTRTVRPAGGLARGTHMAIITVMYNGGITASAVVTFTVVQPGAANLSVTAPTFRDEEEGYTATTSSPVAGNIKIENNGNAAATITSVTVTGSSFDKVDGTNTVVGIGASINDWTVQPKSGLARGTHMAIITVTYSSTGGTDTASAVITFTVTQPAQTRALTVIAPEFADVYTAYTQPTALSIIITNTGNATVTISSVTITASTPASPPITTPPTTIPYFIIGTGGSYTVGAGSSIANWTVRPKANLPAGTYTATITVTYNNGTSDTTAPATVTFTVMARERFVAVAWGYNGDFYSDKAFYSDGNGGNWKETKMPSATGWYSVTYGGGKYVAVALNSNKAAYSYDGINWLAATLPSSADWMSVTYGGGVFVAVADANNKAAYSYDGITWIAATQPPTSGCNSVTYGDGVFVAVGHRYAAHSTNGRSWTAASITPSTVYASCQSVTYGYVSSVGTFVAVASGAGANDRSVAISTDGAIWSIQTSISLPKTSWTSVTYGGGTFVAVHSPNGTGTYGEAFYSTNGGSTWTKSSLTDGNWSSVTYGNDKFVAISTNTNPTPPQQSSLQR